MSLCYADTSLTDLLNRPSLHYADQASAFTKDQSYLLIVMIINIYGLVKLFIRFKESCAVWWRLVYCIAEARSAQQIWEARCLHNGGSWRPGVPSLVQPPYIAGHFIFSILTIHKPFLGSWELRSRKKFVPNWFSRFDVYRLQTNNRQVKYIQGMGCSFCSTMDEYKNVGDVHATLRVSS